MAHPNVTPRITNEMRLRLERAIDHASHILPPQGPIETFVHHNTLHGLQHLRFEEAIAEATAILGGRGYLSLDEYRRLFASGRISRSDLHGALREQAAQPGRLDEVISKSPRRSVTAREIRELALLYAIDAPPPEGLARSFEDDGALRELRRDIPPDVRAALLERAASELRKGLDQVGRSLTLSDWVRSTLGLDLPRRIRAEVIAAAGEGDLAPASLDRGLDALKIPDERRSGYLACIDEHLGSASPEAHRALWLRQEARRLKPIFRAYFGCRGTLEALLRALSTDPEHIAVRALWHASLAAFDIDDPLAPICPDSLEEHDPRASAGEAMLERFKRIERWAGPPIPVHAGLRAQIEALAKAQERPEEGADEDLAAAASSHRASARRLSRTALSGLSDGSLTRRGLSALETLISMVDEPARYASVLGALRRLDPREQMLERADRLWGELLGRLGNTLTHRDLLLALTGEDINASVHRYVQRCCAAFLDEGVAGWAFEGRPAGFYDAWRALAASDRSFEIEGLRGARDSLHALPPLASDAVIEALLRLGVEEDRWEAYIQRLLVDLRGYSGMIQWRQKHAAYPAQAANPINLIDYLAVRLVYEEAAVRRACRSAWRIDGRIDGLRRYFQAHRYELLVRRALFAGELPEILAEEARRLIASGPGEGAGGDPFQHVADALWVIYQGHGGARAEAACRKAVRCFYLAQHLGITAGELAALPAEARERLIAELDAFPPEARAPAWQRAYEIHYRDEVLSALAARRKSGLLATGREHAAAQVVFCIDDREESIRRHIEELNDRIETFAAAGFFGVAMLYRGLDDTDPTPLCPIVVTPVHEVTEIPRPEAEDATLKHERGRTRAESARGAVRELSRGVLSSYAMVNLTGIFASIPILGRLFAPRHYERAAAAASRAIEPPVLTELSFDAGDAPPPSGGGRRQGFTLTEQVDRVANTLRSIGLVADFAPLIVLMGHGSISRNNPHLSAYDCGACGGKHGGPNGRLFAAMANRPEVRAALRGRGIDIPDSTWFIGAEHNTCNDIVTYFDLDDLPEAHRRSFADLSADLHRASARSAEERCRKFESAPSRISPERALRHVLGRAADISQARPELGHATNACAIIGRRAITQGVFLDRRAFLVSYDASRDPEGTILEAILLAVGPVGAGINLEYYFSTVDNARYGCGTKLPHNLCGLVGVLEGTEGDLRTGLPRQMIEVHEPMRLQIIVEAKTSALGAIYGRREALRELIGNGWTHLIAIDPDTGETSLFDPAKGFVPWESPSLPIAVVGSSREHFRGKIDFLPPALIEPSRRETYLRDAANG